MRKEQVTATGKIDNVGWFTRGQIQRLTEWLVKASREVLLHSGTAEAMSGRQIGSVKHA